MKTFTPRVVTGTLNGRQVQVLRLEHYANPPTVLESDLPEADPAWRFTDAAGHVHKPETYTDAGGTERVRSWPTIEEVVDETYWCDDCSDMHDSTHLECRICRETITPGSRRAVPVLIPSPMQVRASLSLSQESLVRGPSLLALGECELTVEDRTYRGAIISYQSRFDDERVTYEFDGAPAR